MSLKNLSCFEMFSFLQRVINVAFHLRVPTPGSLGPSSCSLGTYIGSLGPYPDSLVPGFSGTFPLVLQDRSLVLWSSRSVL